MIRKLILSFVALILLSKVAAAEVMDLPAGPYGGMFRDETTGKVWLDVTNFRVMNYAQILAALAGTPFRLATHQEVEELLSSLSGPSLTIGVPAVLPDRSMSWIDGIFDDSDSGQDPNRVGTAKILVSSGGITVTIEDDDVSTDRVHLDSNGAWAVQKLPTTCAPNNSAAADMDCDGNDEKVVWRSNTGTWYIRMSATNDFLIQQWGLPGDIPILGDYDGDHIPDLAVWRPSNGTWYVKTSSSLYAANQATVQQFGLPGDVPMRGDYDGDGVFDFAVWRPQEGNWYVLKSTTHQAVVEQWGLPGDVPVIGGRALH